MVAYSSPMTPAPTTVRLLGTCGLAAMLSLSTMVLSLKGMCFGRNGAVPVAMDEFSASNSSVSPSPRVTEMRCGSRNFCAAGDGLDALRGELGSSTSISWSSVMRRRAPRSLPSMSFLTR